MSWSEVASFFFSCGERGGGVFFVFQVVFGVENGLSSVHFPLGEWTIDFTCSPKSSQ